MFLGIIKSEKVSSKQSISFIYSIDIIQIKRNDYNTLSFIIFYITILFVFLMRG